MLRCHGNLKRSGLGDKRYVLGDVTGYSQAEGCGECDVRRVWAWWELERRREMILCGDCIWRLHSTKGALRRHDAWGRGELVCGGVGVESVVDELMG